MFQYLFLAYSSYRFTPMSRSLSDTISKNHTVDGKSILAVNIVCLIIGFIIILIGCLL